MNVTYLLIPFFCYRDRCTFGSFFWLFSPACPATLFPQSLDKYQKRNI